MKLSEYRCILWFKQHFSKILSRFINNYSSIFIYKFVYYMLMRRPYFSQIYTKRSLTFPKQNLKNLTRARRCYLHGKHTHLHAPSPTCFTTNTTKPITLGLQVRCKRKAKIALERFEQYFCRSARPERVFNFINETTKSAAEARKILVTRSNTRSTMNGR